MVPRTLQLQKFLKKISKIRSKYRGHRQRSGTPELAYVEIFVSFLRKMSILRQYMISEFFPFLNYRCM